LLQTLNILEGVDLKAFGVNSAEYIHHVHEAIKLAYADRNAYYGDPAFTQVPIAGLLSKPYAAERRRLIGPQASLEHRVGDPFRFDPSVKPPAVRYTPHSQGLKTPTTAGDTTCVDVVDKDGNLFSATPSVGVSVVRGRLPPASTFGLSGSRSNTVIRFESGTPVSPAMNAPPSSQPELGVALKRFPSWSTTSTQVVSPAVFDPRGPCECGTYRMAGG